MKLSLNQIMLLAEACRDAAKVYDQRQAAEPRPVMHDYWKSEAERTRELEALLRCAVGADLEVIPTTEEAQEVSAAAASLPSPAAEPPASEAVSISAQDDGDALRSLQEHLRREPAEEAPNGLLEGWDDQEPASVASLTKDQPLPQALASMMPDLAAPSPHLCGNSTASGHAENLPHLPMSSAEESCADLSSSNPAHKDALECFHQGFQQPPAL